MTITYRFGSQTEILDGSTIQYWVSDDGKGNLTVDENQVAVYVKLLAKQYNTAYCTKKLKTSYGPMVTITRGHSGWMIDQKAEIAALIKCIKSGDEARGWSTPAGAFPLTYKQKNAVLKGKNYATPVTYWMPFI